uniref:Lipase n=1 Tax=Rhipicephalus zambeziensis TaxID=60191 RepID=A0A224YY65_9ACAR
MRKIYIECLIFLCVATTRLTGSTVDEDAFKSTAQLIASKGYPVEEYDIMTEDWYIITMQRIPAGRGVIPGGIRKRKPVVFLMSGLEGCSADYVANLPHQSLGFILADNGFDVWIGNVRGTKYSRHLFLKRKHKKFWDFCLDEMIRYDLPAQIDGILYHTGEAALHFVGWSQGGGIMFGLLADRPEYNKKVKLLHALAPAVFMGHMTAPVRILIKMSNPALKIVDLFFGGTVTGRNEQLLSKVKLLSCRSVRPRGLCNASFILMNGGYPIDMNTTRLPVYLANDPAGTSVRNVLHLAQVTMANEFRKFDWGPLKNKRIYGQKRPPLYDIRKVTAPVAIYWGDGDRLTTPRDIARLIQSLPNVALVYKVPVPGFTHLDFGWSITAWQHLYKTIVKMIKLYS